MLKATWISNDSQEHGSNNFKEHGSNNFKELGSNDIQKHGSIPAEKLLKWCSKHNSATLPSRQLTVWVIAWKQELSEFMASWIYSILDGCWRGVEIIEFMA